MKRVQCKLEKVAASATDAKVANAKVADLPSVSAAKTVLAPVPVTEAEAAVDISVTTEARGVSGGALDSRAKLAALRAKRGNPPTFIATAAAVSHESAPVNNVSAASPSEATPQQPALSTSSDGPQLLQQQQDLSRCKEELSIALKARDDFSRQLVELKEEFSSHKVHVAESLGILISNF